MWSNCEIFQDQFTLIFPYEKIQIFRVLKLYGKFAVSLKMPASVLTGVELGDQGDSQVCGRRISVMPP